MNAFATNCTVQSAFQQGQVIIAHYPTNVKSNHLFNIRNGSTTTQNYRLCKQHLIEGAITKEQFYNGDCKLINLTPGQSYADNMELLLPVNFQTGKQNGNSTIITTVDGGCLANNTIRAITLIHA